MLPQGYDIRFALPADVPLLPAIERVSGLLFKSYPSDLGLTDDIYEHVNSVATFEQAREAGHLWVAAVSGGTVVGFAMVLQIGGYAHLDELDVLPQHGRQGIGSALLGTVCSWAKSKGYPAVTLRTFRDVPWNRPFYQRMGFQVVESSVLSPDHLELESIEQRRGLRIDIRVTMAYKTSA